MKIVVLDGELLNPGDIDWAPLEDLGELTVYPDTEQADFHARVAGADVVCVNKVPVRGERVSDMAECGLLGVLATGTNIADLDALAKAGIPVCNVPAYGVEDVAQHALALLMELARDTAGHSASVKRGEWSASGQWCYWLKTPLCLAGLNLGIIGFGAIGQALGRMGRAMGMNVLAYSRHRDAQTDYPFTWASLEEIWSQADVISLHCPLTPQTAKIINAKTLAAMRPGAILINTARGGLVDEDAAADALLTGKLAGLGVDVLATEPPSPDNPLLTAPNTLITPHMAWATRNARRKIIAIMAENIAAWQAGAPQNVVNPAALIPKQTI